MASPGLLLFRSGLAGAGTPLSRVALISLVEAAPAVAAGVVTATAIDRGFLAGRPLIGLAWLSLLAGLHVLRATAERCVFPYLTDVVEPLRDHLVGRLVSGTLHRATDRAGHPEGVDAATVSRLTRQVESVRSLVGALLRTARPLAVTLIAATVGLATLHIVLVGFVLPPLLLVLAVFPLSLRVLTRRRRLLVLADEQITAEIGGSLLAARDLAALDAADQAVDGVEAAGQALRRAGTAAAWVGGLRVLMVTVGGYLPLFALLLAGPALVRDGRVSTGDLIGAAVYLTGYLLPAIQSLTGTVSAYYTQLVAALTRLAEAAGPSRTTVAPSPSDDPGSAGGAVSVRDLTFAYGPRADPVLVDLSFTLVPGEHLAVVGASGIGKSTLANLLTGLERPRSGEVRLDGVPAHGLDDVTRPAHVALVPQEAYLFVGTVLANLAYLRPGVERSEVDTAVRLLGATGLVDRLGGLDGEITDPATQCSSGERQLLVLVRAYLSPARLVILDEAACHLDPAAEARAEAAFAARSGTLVVIAHRLASATRAGQVLLVESGGATLGTHADLLAGGGAYAELMGGWGEGTGV